MSGVLVGSIGWSDGWNDCLAGVAFRSSCASQTPVATSKGTAAPRRIAGWWDPGIYRW